MYINELFWFFSSTAFQQWKGVHKPYSVLYSSPIFVGKGMWITKGTLTSLLGRSIALSKPPQKYCR